MTRSTERRAERIAWSIGSYALGDGSTETESAGSVDGASRAVPAGEVELVGTAVVEGAAVVEGVAVVEGAAVVPLETAVEGAAVPREGAEHPPVEASRTRAPTTLPIAPSVRRRTGEVSRPVATPGALGGPPLPALVAQASMMALR